MASRRVLERAVAMVNIAKARCEDIEFLREDATRSEPDFLCRFYEAVIKPGHRHQLCRYRGLHTRENTPA